MIRISDTVTLPDDQIKERFVRSIGPRGENPHKYATSVELRLDVQHAPLPKEMKQRLSDLAGRHITKEGVLVVAARECPSQLRVAATYAAVISAIVPTSEPESGTNPNTWANGANGIANAITMRTIVDRSNRVPGRLRKNGRVVRITSVTTSSVSNDSTNHAVRKSSGPA